MMSNYIGLMNDVMANYYRWVLVLKEKCTNPDYVDKIDDLIKSTTSYHDYLGTIIASKELPAQFKVDYFNILSEAYFGVLQTVSQEFPKDKSEESYVSFVNEKAANYIFSLMSMFQMHDRMMELRLGNYEDDDDDQGKLLN